MVFADTDMFGPNNLGKPHIASEIKKNKPKNIGLDLLVFKGNEVTFSFSRKHWDEQTAKRIHVVVRVRPMSVKEIRENAKV